MSESASDAWQTRVHVDGVRVLEPVGQAPQPFDDVRREKRTVKQRFTLVGRRTIARIGHRLVHERALRGEAAIAGRLHELWPPGFDHAKPCVFVIATQSHDVCGAVALELANSRDYAGGVRASIEVVPRENESIAGLRLGQAPKKALESAQVPVDITDCEGSPHGFDSTGFEAPCSPL